LKIDEVQDKVSSISMVIIPYVLYVY
jgi:hypothetical protein